MAAAGENCAGDSPFERSEESELAEIEREMAVGSMEFDAIGGSDFVDGGGIDAELNSELHRCLAENLRRRIAEKGITNKHNARKATPGRMTESVGTFGMGKQGVLKDR